MKKIPANNKQEIAIKHRTQNPKQNRVLYYIIKIFLVQNVIFSIKVFIQKFLIFKNLIQKISFRNSHKTLKIVKINFQLIRSNALKIILII